MPLHIQANGSSVRELALRVPNVGIWSADVELVSGEALDGAVTLTVGETTLVGTVVAHQSGSFALRRRARVVGGSGGWTKTLAHKSYHNDAGVKARLIAEDAARECGETLGSFVPALERVGVDFVRERDLAVAALVYASGGNPWHVDYTGTTHVGPRPTVEVDAGAYSLLDFDARAQIATLAVDDLSAIQIGAILTSDRLDSARTIRDFELTAADDKLRITAWCTERADESSRLAGLIRALVERFAPPGLFGVYRYRVVNMSAERVSLQAIRRDARLPEVLPDMSPISQWSGVAGAHAELKKGAEVLVCFIDGDPAQPVITSFVGKGGPGHVPDLLTLGGDSGAAPAARQGDSVSVVLPPVTFSGNFTGKIGGVDSTGVVTGIGSFPQTQTLGVITTGSSKVRIAK